MSEEELTKRKEAFLKSQLAAMEFEIKQKLFESLTPEDFKAFRPQIIERVEYSVSDEYTLSGLLREPLGALVNAVIEELKQDEEFMNSLRETLKERAKNVAKQVRLSVRVEGNTY